MAVGYCDPTSDTEVVAFDFAGLFDDRHWVRVRVIRSSTLDKAIFISLRTQCLGLKEAKIKSEV